MRKSIAIVCLLSLAGLVFAACGDDDNGGSATATASGAAGGTQAFDVKLTDDGCDPRDITLPAGPTKFNVTNDGAAEVTEFEILDGDRIIGEVENVIEGIEKSFSLNLSAGTFEIYCPGGSTEKGTLTVTSDDG